MGVVDRSQISRLSPMQAKCLRMTYDRMSGGQVAQQLGISKSTVETHLAQARKVLGVNTSIKAAILLHEHEAAPPSCDVSTDTARGDTPPNEAPRIAEPDRAPTWRDLLPVRPKGAIDNDSSVRQRLFWLFFLPVAASIGFGMLAVGFDVVSRIVAGR